MIVPNKQFLKFILDKRIGDIISKRERIREGAVCNVIQLSTIIIYNVDFGEGT